MVASELTINENNLVLTFNGWLFEGYDDAKAALMETIHEGINVVVDSGFRPANALGKQLTFQSSENNSHLMNSEIRFAIFLKIGYLYQ